jgi:hypothetical protein
MRECVIVSEMIARLSANLTSNKIKDTMSWSSDTHCLTETTEEDDDDNDDVTSLATTPENKLGANA